MNQPDEPSYRKWCTRCSVIVPICLTLVGAFAGWASSAPSFREAEWRVQIHRVVVQTSHLKPPQEENVINLDFENNSKRSLWFVWSTFPEQTLPSEGRYRSFEEKFELFEQDIDCEKLRGKGVFRLIHFSGDRREDRFFSMLLKPGARVRCKQMPIVSWGRLDKLIIHIAPSLMVDGKFPLEDWLPYDPGNVGKVTLDTDTYEFGSALNSADHAWKPGKGIPDVRALRLQFIEIKSTGSFTWTAEDKRK